MGIVMPGILAALAVVSVVVLAPIPVLLGIVVARYVASRRTRNFLVRLIRERGGEILDLSIGRSIIANVNQKHLAKYVHPALSFLWPALFGAATTIVIVWYVPWAPRWNDWIVQPLLAVNIPPAANSAVAITFGVPIIAAVSAHAMTLDRYVSSLPAAAAADAHYQRKL